MPNHLTADQLPLNQQQYELLQQIAPQLQAAETHPDRIHFAVLKQRYYKIIKTDAVIESMLACDLPILPKPVLTFSVHRHYPIQFDQLNYQQQRIIKTFLTKWEQLNLIQPQ